mmetsp:Transcript_29059/g.40507  ORF Transcript_29059/g.40507 Transcript_29059/m.40507 type:complete len:165 (-) Transcript_29059:78-572(-)
MPSTRPSITAPCVAFFFACGLVGFSTRTSNLEAPQTIPGAKVDARCIPRRGIVGALSKAAFAIPMIVASKTSAIDFDDARSHDWKKFDEIRSDKRGQKGYPSRCGYDYCQDGKIVVPLKYENGTEYWVEKDGPEDLAARAQKKMAEIESRQQGARSRPKYRSAY